MIDIAKPRAIIDKLRHVASIAPILTTFHLDLEVVRHSLLDTACLTILRRENVVAILNSDRGTHGDFPIDASKGSNSSDSPSTRYMGRVAEGSHSAAGRLRLLARDIG